jgi:hypothetical protein
VCVVTARRLARVELTGRPWTPGRSSPAGHGDPGGAHAASNGGNPRGARRPTMEAA